MQDTVVFALQVVALLSLMGSLESCVPANYINDNAIGTLTLVATDAPTPGRPVPSFTPTPVETMSRIPQPSPVRSTAHPTPKWTTLGRGSYVVYAELETNGGDGTLSDSLYALPMDGGGPQLIASRVSNGHLSPDGRRVAYLEIADGFGRVWILDLSTGSRSQVQAGNGCLDVSWSPDGTELACSGEKDIFVFGPYDRVATLITTWSSAGYEDTWALPTWSPNGDWLAFFNLLDFQVGAEDGLYITNLSCRTEPTTCPDKTLGPFGKFTGMSRPAWSPDGRRVAIGDVFTLYVLDIEGNEITEIATSQEYMIDGVAWSPDGTQIAYSENGEIKLIPYIGGDETTIATIDGVLLDWIEVQ